MTAPGRLRLTAAVAGRIRAGWRSALGRVWTLIRAAAITFVVVTVTLWLVPGVKAADVADILGLVLLVAAIGAVLRPLLLAGVRALGGLAAMALGACVQGIVVAVALRVDPGNHVTGLPSTVAAAVVAVIVAALLNWFADAGTDASFVAEVRRLMARTRRRQTRKAGIRGVGVPPPGSRPPGVLIVQLDGVSAPVLQWAVRAGNLPTIGGWVGDGSHVMVGWHTGLPATTPAAQAGILHGNTDAVPAYRWYDKVRGRLVVASSTRDAADVERRLSNGNGLLRDGGVSVSNAFSGDAPTSLLTVSRAGWPGRSARGWAVFMASPFGFTRALVLGVAEMVMELHQARLQRRRNVRPRVNRLGPFLALRPAAMLLRDVSVSLVAEQMALGAPVIYCDLVDYDEVAHHAGPARPEALKALENVDHTVGILQRLVAAATRDYHLVVLSDHGQSFGATFRHRHRETLDQVVSRLTRRDADDAAPPPQVVASGNLAMIYLTDQPGKLTRAAIETAYPDLVTGLITHPGIGLVVVDGNDGPVAHGRHGCHHLRQGTVEGEDPLPPYGPRARTDLLRHQSAEHVGDLVVISTVDPIIDEIAAFEELVGSHGGLGGWQTEAALVYPAAWPATTGDLDGPVAVHRQLVTWLQHLGLRRPIPSPPATAAGAQTTTADQPTADERVATGRLG